MQADEQRITWRLGVLCAVLFLITWGLGVSATIVTGENHGDPVVEAILWWSFIPMLIIFSTVMICTIVWIANR